MSASLTLLDPQSPQSDEAEMSLIGAMLIDPLVAVNLSWVKPDWFLNVTYRAAWEAGQDLVQRGQFADFVAVSDILDVQQGITEASMQLTEAVVNTPTSQHADHYASILHEKALRRELIAIGSQLASQAYKAGSVENAAKLALQRLSNIQLRSGQQQHGMLYKDWLDATYETTSDRFDGKEIGIYTGYSVLDRITKGLDPGSLILLAGRPGSGKSALGANIARRIAGRLQRMGKGGRVDIITMEMDGQSVSQRLIAASSGIDTRDMRAGFRDEYGATDGKEWDTYTRWVALESEYAGDTLYIHDVPMSTDQIFLHAMQAQAQHGMQVLIVDQLDLATDEVRDSESVRIGKISQRLKTIAKQLNIVIICLAQLNREVEKRGNHRPQLSDLRMSGRLEQDADSVWLLYRPAAHYPYVPGEDPPAYEEYAVLEMAKYRNGVPHSMIPLKFAGPLAAFFDWETNDNGITDQKVLDCVKRKEGGHA